MTDVINGKNRERRSRNKVILPIFTQFFRALPSMISPKRLLPQKEKWFQRIIEIKIL